MFIRRLLIALCLLFPAKGFAADSTVAALSAASALAGSELFYCVQSSADKKCTASQISTFVLSTFPATTCTNQFVRSIAATTGAGTCASVASADLSALAGQYPGTAGSTAASSATAASADHRAAGTADGGAGRAVAAACGEDVGNARNTHEFVISLFFDGLSMPT